jgi:uncharacterized protein YkwD
MHLRFPLTIAPLAVLATVALVFSVAGSGVAAPSLDIKEQALLEFVNGYRQENGLGTLVPSAELNAAADWFANDMASKGYFPDNHVDSLGRTPTQRGAAFGYPWGWAKT